MSQYLRLAQGLNPPKSEFISSTENIFKKIKNQQNKDWYASIYQYNEDHYKTFKQTKSVQGIEGLRTSKLVFDFDDKTNVENARKDAVELCNRLIKLEYPKNDISIYYSGNKGFHVICVTKESLVRQEFVNIVFNLAADLKSFDQEINDNNRILRVPLTKHNVSGLYKIPISYDDLKNMKMEEIRTLAKDVSGYDESVLDESKWIVDMPEQIKALKTKEFKRVNTTVIDLVTIEGDIFNKDTIDFSSCPRWMSKDRFALKNGRFLSSDNGGKGERNSAFMILAATYRNQGFSADETLALLVTTAEKQAKWTSTDPWTEVELKSQIISSVYSAGWKGGIFGRDEDLLVMTRMRFDLEDELDDKSSAIDIEDVGNGFKEFAKQIKSNRIMLGLESLDKDLVLTTGMTCALVAAPGAGKSAIANLFAETVSKNNEDVLYFSLDLFRNLLFNRLLQRHINYDFQTILDQFESGDIDKELLEAYSTVVESYNNVNFVFKTSTLEDIEAEIQRQTSKRGKSPKLVIVDYLDKVRTPYSDPTHASAMISGRLSDIAKKYNCLVLLIVQPSKSGSSGPEQEFKSYRSLKGSSSIESEARVILSAHRPGYNISDTSTDKYITVSILKNNTGRLGQYDYSWDGLSGSIRELDGEQTTSLRRLKEDLESKKEKNPYDDM